MAHNPHTDVNFRSIDDWLKDQTVVVALDEKEIEKLEFPAKFSFKAILLKSIKKTFLLINLKVVPRPGVKFR